MSTGSFALLEAPSRVQELDRLGDEIATLSAHLDAPTARLLALIRDFDARGGWNTGFRSCAEWLSWRVGLDLGAARERVRVAHALGGLPLLADALARGQLSYAKVRALTRVATPETEAKLLAVGRVGTAAHVERIVRAWRRVDRRAEAREAAPQHAGRALHVIQDEDGTVAIRGRLTPEASALLLRARAARPAALPRTQPWRRPCGPSLLCRRHHRAVHEENYQVTRGPDGGFQFRRPDGRELPDVPSPAELPADPVETLQAASEARQVWIHARTACAGWLGERLDLGWAIDILHPQPATAAAVGSDDPTSPPRPTRA